ncbi:BNR repeat-containing protein [Leifsonia sp. McL0607]|uniref:BNR repeat-containing protein n=1 Tax=Leifsonia sp. McL0607 TaxID=3415672 RepID=UPI003CF1CE18
MSTTAPGIARSRGLRGAIAAAAIIVSSAGMLPTSTPHAAAASTLDCPYQDPGGITPPAKGKWKVESSSSVLDATGAPARTFAGWMVPQEVLEAGDTTYVGYFDAQKRLTIAKQKAGGAWSSVTLERTLNLDSHARIVLALDTNGNLHVKTHTGSSDKLEYWVTTAGDDLKTLKAATMIPRWTATHDGVQYPMEDLANRYSEFFTGADGELFFRGRVGSAGGANTIVLEYDAASRAWQLHHPKTGFHGLAIVFNGWAHAPFTAAYPSEPVKGPDGRFHMIWTWRGDSTADSNSEVHYASSADMRTWYNIKGEAVFTRGVVQFTHGLKSTMVDPVSFHGGLLNGTGMALGFDDKGKPLVSYYKYVGTGAGKTTQLFTARPEVGTASGWKLTQVSAWKGLYDLERREDSFVGDMNIMTMSASSGAVFDGKYLTLDYTCQTKPHRLYLDPSTGARVADLPLPDSSALPAEMLASVFARGYTITARQSWSRSSNDEGATVLGWEAGPYNVRGTQDNYTNYPREGSPLTVYRLVRQ